MTFLMRSFSLLRKPSVATGIAGTNLLETLTLIESLGLVLHLYLNCIIQLQTTDINIDATEHHLGLGMILVEDDSLVQILANDPFQGTVDIQETAVHLGIVVIPEIDDPEMVHSIVQGTLLEMVPGTLQGMVQDIILDGDPTIEMIVQAQETVETLLTIVGTIDASLVTETDLTMIGTDVPTEIHLNGDTEAMIEGTAVPIDTEAVSGIEVMTGTDSPGTIIVPVLLTETIQRHTRKVNVKRKKDQMLTRKNRLTLLITQRLNRQIIKRRKMKIILLILWNSFHITHTHLIHTGCLISLRFLRKFRPDASIVLNL